MNIGEYIINTKNKLGFKSFADMAKVIDIPSSFLLRLSKIQSKEEMKQENIESIEKLARYLQITIDELINPKEVVNNYNVSELKHLIECNDINIAIDEIIQISNKEDIKFDGVIMNEDSKQLLRDLLDIVRQLMKNKL